MTWAGTESMEMVPPSESPVSTLLIPEGTVASPFKCLESASRVSTKSCPKTNRRRGGRNPEGDSTQRQTSSQNSAFTQAPCRRFLNEFAERPSGRRPDELRPVRLLRNFTATLRSLVEFGDTRHLHRQCRRARPAFLKGKGEGWVTAEYGMLPRSTHTRSDREAARGKQGGRTQEIQRLIGRSLRAVFDLAALGERIAVLSIATLFRPTAARAPRRSPVALSPRMTRAAGCARAA